MELLQDTLSIKLALLTRGLKLPIDALGGRKGGAGPTLGRYFKHTNCIINTPMYTEKKALKMNSMYVRKLENNKWRIPELKIDLDPINPPTYYHETLPNGIPMRKIALLHGSNCLATTIIQHCDYWPHSQCHFCSIPYSLKSNRTVLQKKPEDFLHVLNTANRNSQLIKHITLTSGTLNQPDRGIDKYIDFVKTIRQETNIPIHIQTEPPEDLKKLDELLNAGVDTIGIHLEIFDDDRRRKYCPGKYKTASLNQYKQAWRYAVDLFGENQVSTYILLGLDESPTELLQGVQICAELGVIPLLTPFRPSDNTYLANKHPSYVNQQNLVSLHRQIGSILNNAGINPRKSKAGCARCGACSAVGEAINMS